MKLSRILIFVFSLVFVSALLTMTCSGELDDDVYIPDDIWVVGGNTYYKFSEALAAVQAGTSKAIDSSNTIKLVRDVGENERGEAIIIPESFTGEVEVNMNGKEYWFEDNLDYFLEVRGGTAVNFVGGTTVISENANLIPKALIIDANTVTLKDQKMDDRRPLPHEAIMITSKGILEIEGESSVVGDITVTGGGQMGISGGTITSSTIEIIGTSSNTQVSKIEIDEGTITVDSLVVGSEASDSTKLSVFNVNGGTIGITSLAANKNSTISISEASSTVDTSVVIDSLASAGTTGEGATVSIASGEVTIGNLVADDASTITVSGGSVILSGSVAANGTTENTGKLYLSGGTIYATDVTAANAAKDQTDGSTAVIEEYVAPDGTEYSVTLETNGGTINSGNITSYTSGTAAKLPTDITKDGSTFEGWYSNSSFTGDAVAEISATATGALTFYAKWDSGVTTETPLTLEFAEAGSFTITYDTNVTSTSLKYIINDEDETTVTESGNSIDVAAGDKVVLYADREEVDFLNIVWTSSCSLEVNAMSFVDSEGFADSTSI